MRLDALMRGGEYAYDVEMKVYGCSQAGICICHWYVRICVDACVEMFAYVYTYGRELHKILKMRTDSEKDMGVERKGRNN